MTENLNAHITYSNILDHEENGLIRTQVHPSYPNLKILNYTQECQFKKRWTPLTRAARGLVIDYDGMIVVARPFPKFFNLGEHTESEIPYDLDYTIIEKMDGSLGILFYYNDEWIWATRGSFTSDQAIKASTMITDEQLGALDPSYTHLFEIIYPDNRIVVDYGKEMLVSLGSIHTQTGVELAPNKLFETPTVYDDFTIEDIQSCTKSNFEGFVVKFENGFRIKIKLDEYVHLHRIVFGLSSYRVWDALQEGNINALLSDVPEEFQEWVKDTAASILREYHEHMMNAYDSYIKYTVDEDRKQTAINYKTYGSEPTSAIFSILDGRDPSDIVWKHVKPEHETIK